MNHLAFNEGSELTDSPIQMSSVKLKWIKPRLENIVGPPAHVMMSFYVTFMSDKRMTTVTNNQCQ